MSAGLLILVTRYGSVQRVKGGAKKARFRLETKPSFDTEMEVDSKVVFSARLPEQQ